jgi:uncharacterized membrane protein (DUF2068 family)
VRAVALFEAVKGALVLVVGFGLLSFAHHDLQATAERLVEHSHLSPARHYPRVFIEAASHVSDSRLQFLAALAFLYAALRGHPGLRSRELSLAGATTERPYRQLPERTAYVRQ